MSKEDIRVVIDRGETFEGTIEIFEDCFFSNATVEGIQDWCDEWGMLVEFTPSTDEFKQKCRELRENSFSKMIPDPPIV